MRYTAWRLLGVVLLVPALLLALFAVVGVFSTAGEGGVFGYVLSLVVAILAVPFFMAARFAFQSAHCSKEAG